MPLITYCILLLFTTYHLLTTYYFCSLIAVPRVHIGSPVGIAFLILSNPTDYLHRCCPLQAPLLASLARCAAHSPHLVSEILLAVESAASFADSKTETALRSVEDIISFVLTVALEVTIPAAHPVRLTKAADLEFAATHDIAVAELAWGACVGVLRRWALPYSLSHLVTI